MKSSKPLSTLHFKPLKIIYNEFNFEIAFGIWKNEKSIRHLAARWKIGKGFPKSRGYPQWFLISSELTLPFLKALLEVPNKKYEQVIDTWKMVLSNKI